MKPPEADDLVRLRTAINPAEAHLIEQTLQANGIQSKAVGDFLDAGIGDIPGLRAEVWVHQRDLARAQAALASAETSEVERAEREE